MSSLINSAMSGLSAAQSALNTVSNNISSYNVAGYTRQTTILGASNSTLTGGGWVGNGVYVSGVQREYDAFITNQLRAAQNQSSGLTTRYQQMSKIDDVLSDTTNSLSANLQDFFKSLQTLVSNAEDPAARQTVLGKADGLVNQFKTNDQYLRDQDAQVNTAISTSVDQINNYAKQIANLNDQISRLTGVGAGASPNELLDQRDQLVSELNKIVGVDVTVQDSGTYNISIANGYTLVQGSNASQLAAVKSSADPARTTIAYVDAAAGNVEISEKQITTGSLGGLLTFRSQDLDQARNTLNQMALAFADAMNTQHQAGFDANGDAGGKLFDFGSPAVLSNGKNTGSASVTATMTDSTKVQATNYKVEYNGTDWTITRLSDNTSFTAKPDASGNLSFDGLNVKISGSADNKDSFIVKPVNDVIVNMDVAISDESKLAMASAKGSGESDNTNGQKLLDLQSAKLVGGNKTFNDAYAALVSTVGSTTASLKTSSETKVNVVTQLTKQQQSISGVNLDEEYGNLQRYQQYYLANAQVLQTASTLFDALINIR
ncbi:TPA: flagellar hook-associated protein FlgK [Enterobacter hormaechei subsp. steigerwaltii]|jgi:flagellar hook-associated protein 1|uniref:flagellar hook-associated protein FlgK n=1 Tax=Enterobacter TaxID=547 RepID=UPI000445FD75|nr:MULTISPECIES: flagellar hook-associated protein FlgK [Enterobacter]ARZ77309.1 flagellar hook-associated protein FlgK [Enterobacter cloacae complex sp.]MBE4899371.1 flagellar hook-associated protein FlgK [Enterobacter cloacae complex sp. P8RS]MVX97531.1 flagellar hook-associated protein FlgK [Enterobacteriaceae bacterium 8376wB9]TZG24227.1 flagellar hook-associated protein FlgK [Enterobacter sp. RVSM5a]CAE6323914.1 Flagellar hook-associated protein 1 [Enterobacter cloacae]HAS0825943.1 flage